MQTTEKSSAHAPSPKRILLLSRQRLTCKKAEKARALNYHFLLILRSERELIQTISSIVILTNIIQGKSGAEYRAKDKNFGG